MRIFQTFEPPENYTEDQAEVSCAIVTHIHRMKKLEQFLFSSGQENLEVGYVEFVRKTKLESQTVFMFLENTDIFNKFGFSIAINT